MSLPLGQTCSASGRQMILGCTWYPCKLTRYFVVLGCHPLEVLMRSVVSFQVCCFSQQKPSQWEDDSPKALPVLGELSKLDNDISESVLIWGTSRQSSPEKTISVDEGLLHSATEKAAAAASGASAQAGERERGSWSCHMWVAFCAFSAAGKGMLGRGLGWGGRMCVGALCMAEGGRWFTHQ